MVGGMEVTVMEKEAHAGEFAPVQFVIPASETSATNEYVPPVVGVPEITPVELLRESPAGNEPEAIDQAVLPTPPVDVRVVV